jgi:hypothetical protein
MDGQAGQSIGCSTGSTPGGGGTAGTQIAGGTGGTGGTFGAPAGNPGMLGQGGAAGSTGENSQVGGGGGGGYFGGGAGGSANGCDGGGGGGGSSFVADAFARSVSLATDSSGTAQLTITSDVTSDATPSFTLGKLRRNRHKGTAILRVNLPAPGTLALTGKGLEGHQSVEGAGVQTLKIRPRGMRRLRLRRIGRTKVRASVTYTPKGADPITLKKKITLIERR